MIIIELLACENQRQRLLNDIFSAQPKVSIMSAAIFLLVGVEDSIGPLVVIINHILPQPRVAAYSTIMQLLGVVLVLAICICSYEASKTCNIIKQWNYVRILSVDMHLLK